VKAPVLEVVMADGARQGRLIGIDPPLTVCGDYRP